MMGIGELAFEFFIPWNRIYYVANSLGGLTISWRFGHITPKIWRTVIVPHFSDVVDGTLIIRIQTQRFLASTKLSKHPGPFLRWGAFVDDCSNSRSQFFTAKFFAKTTFLIESDRPSRPRSELTIPFGSSTKNTACFYRIALTWIFVSCVNMDS